MDSVYDAARKHADELKSELAKLQTFLDLHDHFRNRFGLTAPAETFQAAPSEAKAPIADQAAATHEIHVQELASDGEDAGEALSSEAPAPGIIASQYEAPQHEAPLHGATAADDDARVVQVGQGVLIAASSEAETGAPLGPEATLQSVAEKLAATINAGHPSVTGYTV